VTEREGARSLTGPSSQRLFRLPLASAHGPDVLDSGGGAKDASSGIRQEPDQSPGKSCTPSA